MAASPSARHPRLQRNTFLQKLDEIIPPQHANRTLVLCFDGTGTDWQSSTKRPFVFQNSNVVNFFATLKKDDCSKQLVYYQAGIGTYSVPQIASPMTARLNRIFDTMVGVHLNAHVMGGYEFIMQNYEAGDKICIFGFSRGAYTARALAGMLVGLLPRCNHQQVPFAYKMYSREDEIGWTQSAEFKKAFSIDVDIEFLGVWDTVGSVGVFPRRLPFTASNTHVRHFRHALALDERRVRFIPSFWHRHVHEKGVKPGEMPSARQRKSKHPNEKTLVAYERAFEAAHTQDHPHENEETDIEEVWFAGCHCDVGGGSVANEVRNSLARIPLRWMIRQCFLLKTGIMFHAELLKNLGLDPTTLFPEVKPRPPPVTCPMPTAHPTEEDADIMDAVCPIYDQLEISKIWWLLEWIPAKLRFQNSDNSWTKAITVNRGRSRFIPRQHHDGIKVHRSVKLRMEAEGLNYKPRSQWKPEVVPTWVD
ncbi:hypothetical protein BDZ89DRAFT_1100225 [Hymenopellis radicata]|nr:hypothetical protein BDZ89DRAFT_1100225 [Hymenopellis radicata]